MKTLSLTSYIFLLGCYSNVMCYKPPAEDAGLSRPSQMIESTPSSHDVSAECNSFADREKCGYIYEPSGNSPIDSCYDQYYYDPYEKCDYNKTINCLTSIHTTFATLHAEDVERERASCPGLDGTGKCFWREFKSCTEEFDKHLGKKTVCGNIIKTTVNCLEDLMRSSKCDLYTAPGNFSRLHIVKAEQKLCDKGYYGESTPPIKRCLMRYRKTSGLCNPSNYDRCIQSIKNITEQEKRDTKWEFIQPCNDQRELCKWYNTQPRPFLDTDCNQGRVFDCLRVQGSSYAHHLLDRLEFNRAMCPAFRGKGCIDDEISTCVDTFKFYYLEGRHCGKVTNEALTCLNKLRGYCKIPIENLYSEYPIDVPAEKVLCDHGYYDKDTTQVKKCMIKFYEVSKVCDYNKTIDCLTQLNATQQVRDLEKERAMCPDLEKSGTCFQRELNACTEEYKQHMGIENVCGNVVNRTLTCLKGLGSKCQDPPVSIHYNTVVLRNEQRRCNHDG